MNTVGTHKLDVWHDRNNEIIGAPILLTPDEIKELHENGEVVIKADTID